MNKSNFLLTLVATVFISATQASVYEASWTGAGANHSAGQVKRVNAYFDSGNNRLKFEAAFGKSSQGYRPDAFWLVISPGTQPKGHSKELAIFYYDATSSNSVLTAYNYNGTNGDTSYKTGTKLFSSKTHKSSVYSLTNRTSGSEKILGFDINASRINAHRPAGTASDWTGAKFGSKVSVWMKPVTGANTSYDCDNFLKSFNFCKSGWFEGKDCTEVVPEPASAAVLAVGGAFLAFRRKRKN